LRFFIYTERMETSPRPRVGRILRLTLFLIVALIVVIPFGLGFVFMQVLTVSGCDGDVDPAAFGIEREEITYPSSEFDGDYATYFIPGANDATIIIAPTLRAGRGDRLDELRVFHDAGYNILTYRARTCFGARHSLGYAEATAIGDALAYLATRADVDQNRIGIYGFSAGGAATLIAYGRYPQLRAAVAAGGYHDFDSLLSLEVAQLGAFRGLFDWGARLGYQAAIGESITTLSPLNGVINSAPRPILLVYGSTEVSLDGARIMQAAAPERVRLWVVDGAGHGDYVLVAGEATYSGEVVGFYDEMLLDDES
jgi:uncharacterized protein